jgi:hypothetical protein
VFSVIGDWDCTDHTDERKRSFDNALCPNTPPSIDCDDHVCISELFSCGDGQCITEDDRYIFQTKYERLYGCESWREYNHVCELSAEHSLWTKANGMCTSVHYDDPIYDWDRNEANMSAYAKCIYLIRCALSNGAEQDCPCTQTYCNYMMSSIPCNDNYVYPSSPIFRPYIWTLYRHPYRYDWSTSTPVELFLYGAVKCRGFLAYSTGYSTISSFKHLRNIESLFCVLPSPKKNYSSPQQYSASCWNMSRTFTNRTYAFKDICMNTGECISQYRIGDANGDCYYENDENATLVTMTNFCEALKGHRFRCSPQQFTCISVRYLGRNNAFCLNNYDRIMGNDGRLLETLNCQHKTDDDCSVLKYYVGNSSLENSTFGITDYITAMTRRHGGIQFNYYCDSFWDLSLGQDEQSQYCSVWTCKEHEYQCKTGQCIDVAWICDFEWDCSDATDEEAILLNDNWSIHNKPLNILHNLTLKCKQLYTDKLAFSDICNLSSEYPCYRASAANPLIINETRPCINLTQIGDGIVDCYNAVDEKNTRENCAGDMLGFTYRNEHMWVSYTYMCMREGINSLSRYDSVLCSHKSTNKSFCSGDTDVVCRDGTCRSNARCNGKKECLPHGEDEYWCQKHSSSFSLLTYRGAKKIHRNSKVLPLHLPVYPSQLKAEPVTFTVSTSSLKRADAQLSAKHAYTCNRGMSVIVKNGLTTCFCPPAY